MINKVFIVETILSIGKQIFTNTNFWRGFIGMVILHVNQFANVKQQNPK